MDSSEAAAAAAAGLADLEQPHEGVQRFRKDVLECEDDFFIRFRRDVEGNELRDAHTESPLEETAEAEPEYERLELRLFDRL
jgi:hypothetical protein